MIQKMVNIQAKKDWKSNIIVLDANSKFYGQKILA